MTKDEALNKSGVSDSNTMRGFVLYPTYRMIDGKTHVYLFGKLENGDSFLSIHQRDPYFFVKKKDQEKLELFLEKNKEVRDITDCKLRFENSNFKNFDEEEVVKVLLTFPKQVPPFRKHLDQLDVAYYEADILFSQRFLLDNDIKGCLEITGAFKKGNYVNRIYEEPIVKGIPDYGVELDTFSFDIETNMKASEIFSIAYVCGEKKEVLLCTDKEIKKKEITCFPDEKSMITAFLERVQKIDPDIITGWNLIDFDLDVLRKRCRAYNIKFVLGRADWESSLRIFSDFFRSSRADIAGRQVLDGINLLKDSFIKLPDYKLDTAASKILGEKKSIQFTNKGAEILEMAKNNPLKLAEYNLKDAELVLNILEEKDLINLVIQRSTLTGMALSRVSGSIASFDSLYIRETIKKGYVCFTSQHNEREERIKGGYVMESHPGIYDYVIVCDFKSLYPSIIRTFNIDPFSFHKGGEIVSPNKATFSNEEGILPQMIEHLWSMRDKAKKKNDDIASYAIKITMNSFFGILANPLFRFYSLPMANAITAWGRKIVKETAERVGKEGYSVIYSDTDSIFVDVKVDSYDDAEKIGLKLQKLVNEQYTKEVKEESGRESFLELEFEKVYKRFIMPMVRGSTTGAKKRYAGLLIDKEGKEKIDIVGLEFVRRDWTDLSKEFQMELLDRIFHKKEVFDYIKKFVDEVKEGKKDDLLVYRKGLWKDVKEYVKTTPPHVKAARKLEKIESNVIEYVMTTDGPEPIQLVKHALDYDHYIEKQLKPIADTILVFFNQKFEDIIDGNKQKSLFEF
jgi:DNA polymerase II